MNVPRLMCVTATLCLANCLALAQAPNSAGPAQSGVILRTETRLVLVDVVVTDKKGGYVGDLTSKNFRVWEDKKEQMVKTFSYEGSLAADSPKQYVMFLFDATSMSPSDQAQARQAAAKFAAANSSENWMMAVADFRGGLQITQNFTQDQQRIAKALSEVTVSSLSSSASKNTPPPQNGQNNQNNQSLNSNSQARFTAGSALAALGVLARTLGSIQGRKSVILFGGQFTVMQDQLPGVTALVNACNRSNVTIYPVDVRGVFNTTPGRAALDTPSRPRPPSLLASLGRVLLQPASLMSGLGTLEMASSFQGRGGGGPTGGAPAGGATGGAPAGGGGGAARGGGAPANPGGATAPGRGASPTPFPTAPTNPAPGTNTGRGPTNPNPGNQTGPQNPNIGRGQIPGNQGQRPPQLEAPNEEIAHLLADGTGGFEVRNTNDMLAGLVKIGREQSQYYLLGYTPPPSEDESCHNLKVEVVERSGLKVRSRQGYCSAKPRDLLSGKPAGKALETRAAASQPGNMTGSVQIPYFYTASNLARVNVAMEIPAQPLKFEKVKGKLHAAIDVLGIAYLSDGTAGARFSDTLKLDFDDQKQVDAFKLKPLHYENQFDINSGAYSLKVAFSAGGESFGKVEMPLVVSDYQVEQFGLSSVALSKETHPATELTLGMDSLLIDDQTPLIANGLRIVPAGSNRFKTADPARFYFEIYEPGQNTEAPPTVGVRLRVLDRKTLDAKTDSGMIRLDTKPELGSLVIPVTGTVPVGGLMAGSYLLELQASDTLGNTARKVTQFEVE